MGFPFPYVSAKRQNKERTKQFYGCTNPHEHHTTTGCGTSGFLQNLFSDTVIFHASGAVGNLWTHVKMGAAEIPCAPNTG